MFHKIDYANEICRRQIEMSLLRQLEMSPPSPSLGVWELAVDDGFGDESQRDRPHDGVARHVRRESAISLIASISLRRGNVRDAPMKDTHSLARCN